MMLQTWSKITTAQDNEEEGMSLMQKSVFGGKRRHIDFYFNQAVDRLHRLLDQLPEEVAHIRAFMMGARLKKLRTSCPLPEGHGLDRIARLGALIVGEL